MPLPMFQEKAITGVHSVKHIVAIAAGKGGVGKSTVAAQLGFQLMAKGLKVGLLDIDIYGPSLRKMFPEEVLPLSTKNESSIEIITPALSLGIKLLSFAHFRPLQEASIIRAPIANGIVKQLIHQTIWGALDILLVDFPPGTGDIQLTFSQSVNLSGALLVTTPQEVSVMDVRKALNMFLELKVRPIGIIENMSYYLDPKSNEKIPLFGSGGGERLSQETGCPLLAKIPIDPNISLSGDSGKAVTSTSANIFRELAKDLIEKLDSLKSTNPPKSISQLFQKDDYTFTIVWSDGLKKDYQLSKLQKNCPCASCKERPKTGDTKTQVTAHHIAKVGNYALKIQFREGCSSGIYPLDLLYQEEVLAP